MLMKSKTLTWATLTASLILATGCLRFSEEKKDAAAPVELPKIGLKTTVVETTDLLNPYNVAIEVSAKKYDGLVIVKATEQIPISKPIVGQKISLKSESGFAIYQSLSSVTKTKFDYVDTNVNPEDVFWYAVIRPDADGNSGIIQEQGELPQPTRMAIPAAKADPAVALSSAIVNTGTGNKPYRVKLTVVAPLGVNSALKLVRATTLAQLNLANYTNLANITSMPFEYEDGNLYPTDSAVYAVINTGTQSYNMPSPAAVTLPALNNQFTNLTLTQIKPLGHQPSVKLTFDAVYGKQILKRFVNGMEVASMELAANQTEYLDENVAFDKVLAYRLEQYDYYNNLSGSSANLSVNYVWPIMNFSTEFSAKVNPKASLHQYEIRAQDLSTINRLLKYQISVDGTNFNDIGTLNESTANRAYIADFSAPTVRYFRAIQLDRNNNVLATSPVYTLTIPEDREFSGLNYVNSDLTGLGRIKLNSGASLLYSNIDRTIQANSIISEGASIRAFALGTTAPLNSNGRNAGNLSISVQSATGALTLDARGEAGGPGTPGEPGNPGYNGNPGTSGINTTWVCSHYTDFGSNMWILGFQYPNGRLDSPPPATPGGPGTDAGNGNPGTNGQPGKNGGASGIINLQISESNSGFSPVYLVAASAAGQGGLGGSGGAAGIGGAGGRGGRIAYRVGDALGEFGATCYNYTMANSNYTDETIIPYSWGTSFENKDYRLYHNTGAKGRDGIRGTDGANGPSGLPGHPGQTCIKLPGATTATCS